VGLNLLSPGASRPGTITTEGLAAAVEQAANGIAITDTAGIIQYVNPAVRQSGSTSIRQYVNPAFTAMTGYSSEEAVGLHTRLLKAGRLDHCAELAPRAKGEFERFRNRLALVAWAPGSET
jgi:PAS domain-containing protein